MNPSPTSYLSLIAKGMGMGAADVIPGVSGGTIALVTGIYEELIERIRSIDKAFLQKVFRGQLIAAWEHINGFFLLSVFGGILISVFSLARLFAWLIASHPMFVWAFFFGLIAASALYVGRRIRIWDRWALAFLLLGISLAYFIINATPATTPETYWFIFFSGCIAICAMILPGISGSFILLLLGKYAFMLQAVNNFDLLVLGIFILGCICGLLAFSRIISWMLRHHHRITLAMLTGFMIGSLNKLWPWKQVLETRISSSGEIVPLVVRSISPSTYASLHGTDPMTWSLSLTALLGFTLVWLIERLMAGKQKKGAA